MRKIFSALLILSLCTQLHAHELTIKPKSTEFKQGEIFEATVQSSHKFIIPEEVEILERVKAGIFEDGKFINSKLTADEKNLCINFDVTPKNINSSIILFATKDGETWCITNEGGKSGAKSKLEAQGLKVISANKYDKFAKIILNASHEDKNFNAALNFPLEIIPVTNPADVKTGEYFDVKILLNGQNYTGPVWASYDGFTPEYENTYSYYTEAENGIAHIKITNPGLWGVRAVQNNLPGVKDDYDALNLRSFLLFYVK
mgnify:CR=1 FL=1